MDQQRFDDLTRTLAQRTSRRVAVKSLAGGAFGGALALLGASSHAKSGKDKKPRKPPKPAPPDCCPESHPTRCGLTCTDIWTDPSNCGGCGASNWEAVRGRRRLPVRSLLQRRLRLGRPGMQYRPARHLLCRNGAVRRRRNPLRRQFRSPAGDLQRSG
jgi:hypothetical protein